VFPLTVRLAVLITLLISLPGGSFGRDPSPTPDGIFSLISPASSVNRKFGRDLASFESRFLALTGYPANNYPPVIVILHSGNEELRNVPSLRVDAVEGGGIRIQLDLSDTSLDSVKTRSLVAKAALLREFYAGSAPVAGSRIQEFPDWLSCGLGGLCFSQKSRRPSPASYLGGGSPPSIEDFLVQRPSDDSESSLNDLREGMSSSLVEAALMKDGGGPVFQEWIGRHSRDKDVRTIPSWPSRWPMRDVERRWLLIMAGNRGNDPAEISLQSLPSTMEAYEAILLDVPTPNHSLALLRTKKGGEFIASQLSSRLSALRLRAHPLAAPMIDREIVLLSKVARQYEKKTTADEKSQALHRADIIGKATSIGEYLDWYEASKAPEHSGLFDRLLVTPELTEKKGPIGHYLDTVESRGW